MEYGPSDSSGTDDDLPPSHQNRLMRGPVYAKTTNEMEIQIHQLEQEAYSAVLKAFKAQSDAITWEKESMITELRKELRVTDGEHRELLSKVNADDIIRRIRDWRQAGGFQSGRVNNSQYVNDRLPSPTASASWKRKKTFQSIHVVAPSSVLNSQPVASTMQPSLSAVNYGAVAANRGKFFKSISSEDIRWEGDDPGISRIGRSGPGRAAGRTAAFPGAGRGRGFLKNKSRKGYHSFQNGGKLNTGDIEILHTDTLIREVERVFGASRPDPLEMEKAKKLLKEHEQSLVDAIARLAEASDGGNAEGAGDHYSHGQTVWQRTQME